MVLCSFILFDRGLAFSFIFKRDNKNLQYNTLISLIYFIQLKLQKLILSIVSQYTLSCFK